MNNLPAIIFRHARDCDKEFISHRLIIVFIDENYVFNQLLLTTIVKLLFDDFMLNDKTYGAT